MVKKHALSILEGTASCVLVARRPRRIAVRLGLLTACGLSFDCLRTGLDDLFDHLAIFVMGKKETLK